MMLLINCLIVAIVVLIHYEFLYRFTQMIPKMKIRHRFRVVASVFSALIAHTIEIFIFAVAYYFLHQSGDWGYLSGNFNGSMMDCVYYSFTIFTTLGFGDIIPRTTTAAMGVTMEVILGYIMLGGLITIFASKLSRRGG